MPIKIPNDLPAVKTLNNENIFVMTETRAITQDIRPLKILLLNLMPKKIETETQISRLLGNSPLQVDLEFLHTKSHVSKNTSAEHLFTFYKTFEDVRGRTADAYTVSWENTYYLYMENVLNYPVKRSYLTKDDQAAVDAMPTFPADGCCAFIGDTLVVKVGSVVVTDFQ